ncbi:MAG TPA: hypothetical protein VK034_20400 [Enhygromyxa sp.]|nr:hypothetical protein [Enhygromyxa sp.]
MQDAIGYLEAASDLDMVRYASSLAATACDRLKELYPTNSPEHRELEQRAAAFRARSQPGAEDDV